MRIATALLACALGCAMYAPAAEASKEKVLYSFARIPDAEGPGGNLIDVHGTLYGMAGIGGINNYGAVFSFNSKTGTEGVPYSFCSQKNCTDGAYPYGGLIDVHGTLYGTTQFGGTGSCSEAGEPPGCGTVFSLDPATGSLNVLYAFQGTGMDGWYPAAGLIYADGVLYGTTVGGGSGCGCGTVFSLDPETGAEKALYAFQGNFGGADGAYPYGDLVSVDGTLYGTTSEAGSGNCLNGNGCGTVFSLDPKTGRETVRYSFQNNGTDGYYPFAGLIYLNGVFYGTTEPGGNGSCTGLYFPGCGTVFALDRKTSAEKVLYAFQYDYKDGSYPTSGLLDVKGRIYGTTWQGGRYDYGTVFSLDAKTGAESVLHSFDNNDTDGGYPLGGLIDVDGKLFGTTDDGGTYGFGTVFAIAP
jgi:uncharacterized repeat protein (TIGR03803 family)